MKNPSNLKPQTSNLSDEAKRAASASGFSHIAPLYDEDFDTNPAARWMRGRSLGLQRRRFKAGDHVIEMGSGTGEEALTLARQGVHVLACDPATALLDIVAARAAADQAVADPRTYGSVATRPYAAGELGKLVREFGPHAFDGAYSSFGPLNCEPDMTAVADALSVLIRPGGRLIFSVMNTIYPVEIAWFLLHGDKERATRRHHGWIMGNICKDTHDAVPTRYYRASQFRAYFAPYFRQTANRALPLLMPPPYLAIFLRRYPRLFKLIAKLDIALAPHWPFNALGDHFWIELVRR